MNTIYQEAEALLANRMPVVPLWSMVSYYGYSERVTNVKVIKGSNIDLAAVSLK